MSRGWRRGGQRYPVIGDRLDDGRWWLPGLRVGAMNRKYEGLEHASSDPCSLAPRGEVDGLAGCGRTAGRSRLPQDLLIGLGLGHPLTGQIGSSAGVLMKGSRNDPGDPNASESLTSRTLSVTRRAGPDQLGPPARLRPGHTTAGPASAAPLRVARERARPLRMRFPGRRRSRACGPSPWTSVRRCWRRLA